jgi:hypothetical protein
MVVGKADVTEKYVRVRMRDPDKFIRGSIRTHDIGREGFSKRLAGKLKSTGEWATQSWLISREEPKQRAEKLLEAIEYDFQSQNIPFNKTVISKKINEVI